MSSLYHCEGCSATFTGYRRGKGLLFCDKCATNRAISNQISAQQDEEFIQRYWKVQDAIQSAGRIQIIEIPHSGSDEDNEAFRGVFK